MIHLAIKKINKEVGSVGRLGIRQVPVCCGDGRWIELAHDSEQLQALDINRIEPPNCDARAFVN